MAGLPWEDRAACAPQNREPGEEDLDWFSTDRDIKYGARAICRSRCTVRKECIQTALNNFELYGIWGGCDDYEIRRDMSVDCNGEPIERDMLPRCPYCLNRNLSVARQKSKKGYRTECPECGLTWHMATVPAKMKAKKT